MHIFLVFFFVGRELITGAGNLYVRAEAKSKLTFSSGSTEIKALFSASDHLNSY